VAVVGFGAAVAVGPAGQPTRTALADHHVKGQVVIEGEPQDWRPRGHQGKQGLAESRRIRGRFDLLRQTAASQGGEDWLTGGFLEMQRAAL